MIVLMDRCIIGWMNEWMGGWMDEWSDELINGRMNE